MDIATLRHKHFVWRCISLKRHRLQGLPTTYWSISHERANSHTPSTHRSCLKERLFCKKHAETAWTGIILYPMFCCQGRSDGRLICLTWRRSTYLIALSQLGLGKSQKVRFTTSQTLAQVGMVSVCTSELKTKKVMSIARCSWQNPEKPHSRSQQSLDYSWLRQLCQLQWMIC